jgi:DNA-directed RNA polymerase subunit omega
MARVTVEDSLEEIPNRFALVLTASERTKQLIDGADCLIDDDRSNKEVVVALREIAAGRVTTDASRFDVNEALRTFAGPSSREDLPPAAEDDLPPAADDDLPPSADDDLPPMA